MGIRFLCANFAALSEANGVLISLFMRPRTVLCERGFLKQKRIKGVSRDRGQLGFLGVLFVRIAVFAREWFFHQRASLFESQEIGTNQLFAIVIQNSSFRALHAVFLHTRDVLWRVVLRPNHCQQGFLRDLAVCAPPSEASGVAPL